MQEPVYGRLDLRTTIMLACVLLAAGCHSADITSKMKALCKLDGGVRVFESVTLPDSYFENVGGGVRTHSSMTTGRTDGSWFSRIGDDEYRVIWTETFIVGRKSLGYDHEESLVRSHTGIYKWPEKRLLGEEVSYHHGYGTRFSFGFQPGGSSCPTPRGSLLAGVFLKVNDGK